MDSECIQIRSRNATEERKWIERFGQEIKKNNGHKALQTKSNVDRLYIKRNKGGKSLIHVESCVRKDENSLGFFMLRILKKTSSGELLQLRQSILKTLSPVENKKKLKQKNLNKTGKKKKCMDSLSGKCQRKLIWIKLGNGYSKVIWRSEQECCFVLHRSKSSGETM